MQHIIYKLTAPNGKVYIGQTQNFRSRFYNYKNLNCKNQTKLYNSLKKYGWENFITEILEYTDENLVDDYEQHYIKKFNCVRIGLNLESGGNKNKLISQETKEKMRIAKLGKKQSPEAIEKTRLCNLGKKRSPETIKKMTDRKHSPETIEKIRIAHTGQKHSPETIEKIRTANTGKKFSPETIEKIRIAKTNKKHSLETIEKMSIARTGKKHSEETKLKMRHPHKKRN